MNHVSAPMIYPNNLPAVQYNGVEDLGLADVEDLGLVAFMSADLNFLSLEFDLLQYLQIPICGRYISPEGDSAAANGNDEGNANGDDGCPGDGVYEFNVPYFLPEDDTKESWLATGWDGEGEILIYSAANDADSLMGSCQLRFGTAVSSASDESVMSKVPIPSSFVTAAVIFAFVCFLVLTCLYRMVRDIASGKKKEKKKQLDEESSAATEFVSMQD